MSGALTPQQLARLVAELEPAQRETFEVAERSTRLNGMSGEQMEAESRERRKGRFAAPPRADAITPTVIDWLWKGFLPAGALSLLYGTEGEGKSAFTAMVAALATRGKLPGRFEGQPVGVEIFAYEDDASAVLVPRLI